MSETPPLTPIDPTSTEPTPPPAPPPAKPPAPRSRRRLRTPPAELAGMLAAGINYTVIAERLGLDRKAVSEWAALPAIRLEVEQIRQEVRRGAQAKQEALLDQALAVVGAALRPAEVCASCGRGGDVPIQHQLRAAELVLDRTLPKRTAVEIEAADSRTDEDLDREILRAACEVLASWGDAPLVEQLRTRMRIGPP